MKFSPFILLPVLGIIIYSFLNKYSNYDYVNQNNVAERKKITNENVNELIKILRQYDKNFIPKKIIYPNGKISYKYNFIEGEQKLTLNEIKNIIRNPPENRFETEFIKNSVIMLNNADINIILEKTKIIGASAEWEYKNKIVRFNPRIMKLGTRAFAKAMNHEIIHIIQSCLGGNFKKEPVLIGLKINNKKKIVKRYLNNPIYTDISKDIYELEVEAYSYQDNLNFSPKAFTKYCL